MGGKGIGGKLTLDGKMEVIKQCLLKSHSVLAGMSEMASIGNGL